MAVMNTRWCRCDGGRFCKWLLGHLRSTTKEGRGRGGGQTEPISFASGEHDLTHNTLRLKYNFFIFFNQFVYKIDITEYNKNMIRKIN